MTVEHGTISCYTGKATLCRCDECRRAFAAYQRRRRARLRLAGLAPGDERHGTLGGYTNWGCRCVECRRAFAAYQRRRRARLRLAGLAPGDERHGTLGGYTNWGCRCVECLAAMRSYQRQLADGGG